MRQAEAHGKALFEDTSVTDRQVVSDLVRRTQFLSLSISAGTFALLPWRRRPLSTTLAASMCGSIVGLVYGASLVPDALMRIVDQHEPSTLADAVVCPAMLCFADCVDHPGCRQLMDRRHYREATVTRCRARAATRGAASSLGGEASGQPQFEETADPFFAGGFPTHDRDKG